MMRVFKAEEENDAELAASLVIERQPSEEMFQKQIKNIQWLQTLQEEMQNKEDLDEDMMYDEEEMNMDI